MKIYLLNPPFLKNFVRCGRWQGVAARGKTLYYPLWLSYAAGFLEKESHEIKLIDAIAREWDYKQTLEDVTSFNPDLVVIDSNFSSLNNDINFANRIKEEINTLTVLVGPPASQFPEEIIEKGIDIVARFEFESTLKEIAESLENNAGFDGVKGISYKKEGKIFHNDDRKPTTSEFLDEIPFVSEVYKKHLNIKDYFLSHSFYPMVQIFTGRGCPNLCTFCSWPETLMGRDYRVRSVKNVVDEFEYIKNELPEVKEIFIEDDSFTIDKNRLISFCNELKSRKIKIRWSCQSRADLDYETMKIMKDVGCRLLDVGYESGNDEILKNIKKGTTVNQLREFTLNAKKAGLKILADFVIGFPGETKETAEQTISFIKELKPDLLQIAVATPMPGTDFYRYCKDGGYLLNDDLEESLDKFGFQKCIISYPHLNSEEITSYVDTALKGYYLNVSYVPIAMKNVMGKNGLHELKSLITSARMYLSYMVR
ncbi:B12-binding domain-containing radical SAM protein [Methanobacterium oryzae]|uniref:B12-binding domain-containing radical SAM protein n=1 Tax=Methanobacterium oryzae TaxID=69540 RepID=UPI003D233A18